MKQLFVLVFGITMFCSCSKRIVPACVQQKITEIKAQAKWNPPAEIHEYEYNGRKVFLVTADCCDQYIAIIDDTCNYICAPSGSKCKDFYQKAKYKRLVWKDDR